MEGVAGSGFGENRNLLAKWREPDCADKSGIRTLQETRVFRCFSSQDSLPALQNSRERLRSREIWLPLERACTAASWPASAFFAETAAYLVPAYSLPEYAHARARTGHAHGHAHTHSFSVLAFRRACRL